MPARATLLLITAIIGLTVLASAHAAQPSIAGHQGLVYVAAYELRKGHPIDERPPGAAHSQEQARVAVHEVPDGHPIDELETILLLLTGIICSRRIGIKAARPETHPQVADLVDADAVCPEPAGADRVGGALVFA
jgi:hypothetical protein